MKIVGIDHVAIATTDLQWMVHEISDRLCINVTTRGDHPSRGTKTVLFGLMGAGRAQYIEVITVRDPGNAAAQWLLSQLRDGVDRLVAYSVAVHGIQSLADIYGLRTRAGSRINEDGTSSSWTTARRRDWEDLPGAPYFIERQVDEAGRFNAGFRLEGVVVGGSEPELSKHAPAEVWDSVQVIAHGRGIRSVAVVNGEQRWTIGADRSGVKVWHGR